MRKVLLILGALLGVWGMLVVAGPKTTQQHIIADMESAHGPVSKQIETEYWDAAIQVCKGSLPTMTRRVYSQPEAEVQVSEETRLSAIIPDLWENMTESQFVVDMPEGGGSVRMVTPGFSGDQAASLIASAITRLCPEYEFLFEAGR